jgi:hypothetical protein
MRIADSPAESDEAVHFEGKTADVIGWTVGRVKLDDTHVQQLWRRVCCYPKHGREHPEDIPVNQRDRWGPGQISLALKIKICNSIENTFDGSWLR